MTEKIRILITNDDGYHSEGIIALENALSDLGDVYVVAPASEMSGALIGHAYTTNVMSPSTTNVMRPRLFVPRRVRRSFADQSLPFGFTFPL